MYPFAIAIQAIRNSYTMRGIRNALEMLGYAGRGVNSAVLCDSPEFILAAAMARETIGA